MFGEASFAEEAGEDEREDGVAVVVLAGRSLGGALPASAPAAGPDGQTMAATQVRPPDAEGGAAVWCCIVPTWLSLSI